ncbi:hypothetical protein C8A03DRAFT_38318 [Achaetomium macrosporum]|uniref:Uncharacterized protein n=1 Tax=Achaetomium macrosporum TaxID=79813 RepID=A0AAN7C229_9PEZI|nr:hypothetical protein C8A03DRAFT_38318 [Achaetomium macrosporum]
MESKEGREALIITGEDALDNSLDKEDWAFQGSNQEIRALVDAYLAKIQADFPTLIVNSGIGSSAITKRLDWLDFLSDESNYTPKWSMPQSGLASISSTLNTRNSAPESVAHMEKLLFLLGLAIAHELVHLFIGRMTGLSTVHTPGKVSSKSGSRSDLSRVIGESGDYWEWIWFGKVRIEAYRNNKQRLAHDQALDLYSVDMSSSGKSYILPQDWVSNALRFKFTFPLNMATNPFKPPSTGSNTMLKKP